jgi:hypothetical protein
MKKLLLFLALMLWASGAWAAYPNYTVMPSGGDFTTLQGAIADLIANHPVPAGPVTITISGTWASADTTAVNITGITLTGTNTLTISTSGSSIHPGYWSDASPYYRLKVTNNDAMQINSDYVNITGLQLNSICSNGYNARTLRVNNNNISLNRMVLYSSGASPERALYVYAGGPFTLKNSVAISGASSQTNTVETVTNNGQGFFYNNVFINGSNSAAFYSYNNATIKNCYASSASGLAYFSGNGFTMITSASSDTTGTAGLQSIAYSTSSGAKFTNITPGSENFTLTSGSSLIGVGTDLSGTFTDDIIGATRTVPWDIGVFKYGTSATSTNTFFNDVVLNNWTQHG